jgi:hypothetical protein
MTTNPDPETVRALAYKLWVERGRPEGAAEKDWLDAEDQLLGHRKTDSQIVDEAVKESFPASDPPASGLPDNPPANANEKWRAADTGKPSRKRRGKAATAATGATPSPPDEDQRPGRNPRETPPKLGSRDAPGG